ncbi:hypothetical protein O1611_g3476 [Lasiodiplodia mahajangana]|uniref:Uncharacterized protein n=1 Tax=Lasiodiplodia mahajangana TaxID=1108764 RepID=A0ACC2JSB1_9PEZI|nr:hypothetical protein O1611_g3476 [Lasiodiplodia mahajangana]
MGDTDISDGSAPAPTEHTESLQSGDISHTTITVENEEVGTKSDAIHLSSHQDGETVPQPDGMSPRVAVVPNYCASNDDDHDESNSNIANGPSQSNEVFEELLNEVHTLQGRLQEIERKANPTLKTGTLEAEWERARGKLGDEQEQYNWEKLREDRLRMFMEDTQKYENGKKWMNRMDYDFRRRMDEEKEYDDKLLKLRRTWERERGIVDTQQTRRLRQDTFHQLGDKLYDDDFDEQVSPHVKRLYELRRRTIREYELEMGASEAKSFNSYDQRRVRELFVMELEEVDDQIRRAKTAGPRERRIFVSPPLRSPEIDSRDDSAKDKVVEVPLVPVYAKPRLNRVDWPTFQLSRGSVEGDSCTIDVLMGEPVITYDDGSFFGWRRNYLPRHKEKKEVLERKPQVTTNPALEPGQAPLPERIRINSKHLRSIFAKIHGSDLCDSSYGNGSVVIIRPFKALIYYETAFREWYSNLKEKFGTKAPEVPTSPRLDTVSPMMEEKGTTEETGQIKSNDANIGEEPGAMAHEENSGVGNDQNDQDYDKGDETKSKIALEQLSCLLEFLDHDILGKTKYLEGPKCKKIAFSDLWYLFKPGEDVISSDGKQAYRIIGVNSTEHREIVPLTRFSGADEESANETPLQINCVYVDFDGKRLGPVYRTFEIKRFDGERPIASLSVYPFRFHPSLDGGEKDIAAEDELRKKLVKRGRMYLSVISVRHMYYGGPALETRDEIESQVVVDFETAFSMEETQGWKPTLTPLGRDSTEKKDSEKGGCSGQCCSNDNIHRDAYAEKKRNEDYMNSLIPDTRDKLPSVAVLPRSLKDANTVENPLSEGDLTIMSYRVFGFVLRSRKWGKIYRVHIVKYFELLSSPTNRLQSPNPILSATITYADIRNIAKLDLTYLSEIATTDIGDEIGEFEAEVRDRSHATDTDDSDDDDFRAKPKTTFGRLVLPKGKGLILLLHGAPGVGKTTTAEGVAELFKKPLFQITCGDLGSTAKEVESALETNFALASRWGCILLLDEADVFLAARRKEDFVRNGLVAVFLRVLEYYAGILFLTTNRIGDFDEAFASRIHISLHYPALTESSTKKVFKLNLNLIKERFENKKRKIRFSESNIILEAVDYYRRHKDARWNGRQIRNACQTALALAEFEAQGSKHETVVDPNIEVKLKVEHLRTVSDAYLEFIQYLKALYGTSSAGRAKEMGVRAEDGYGGKGDEKHDPLDDV